MGTIESSVKEFDAFPVWGDDGFAAKKARVERELDRLKREYSITEMRLVGVRREHRELLRRLEGLKAEIAATVASIRSEYRTAEYPLSHETSLKAAVEFVFETAGTSLSCGEVREALLRLGYTPRSGKADLKMSLYNVLLRLVEQGTVRIVGGKEKWSHNKKYEWLGKTRTA
jgi:sugar-specific transcriptional regulator TrmB